MPEFTVWGLSMEGRLATDTFWGARVDFVQQDVDRVIGAFDGYRDPAWPLNPVFFPGETRQVLNYEELGLEPPT